MSLRWSFVMLMYSSVLLISFGVLFLDAWTEHIYMHTVRQASVWSALCAVLGSLLLSTGLTLFVFALNLREMIVPKDVFNETGSTANGGKCCAPLVAHAC